MSWRDELRPASFRGVNFHVSATESEIGRRTQLNEFPQRDLPSTADLGRRARCYRIDAFVLGSDVFQRRDALIAALEAPGPAPLIHPFWGDLYVVVAGPIRISESFAEGGYARFSLDFVEAGEQTMPARQIDSGAVVAASADAVDSAVADEFGSSWSVAGWPEHVAAAAHAAAASAIAAIDSARRAIIPDLTAAAELLSSSAGVSNSLADLIRSPVQFAADLQGLYESFSRLGRNPREALDALRKLFGTTSTPVSSSQVVTPARTQVAANGLALGTLTRCAAICGAARQSIDVTYTSYDDAIAVRDELVAAINAEIAVAADALYPSLVTLRTSIIRALAERGANLARITRVSLPETTPALVAAYRLYGDSTQADDLIARNAVRHPGFVPGGVPLEIAVAS